MNSVSNFYAEAPFLHEIAYRERVVNLRTLGQELVAN